jgi:hypothetical protein
MLSCGAPPTTLIRTISGSWPSTMLSNRALFENSTTSIACRRSSLLSSWRRPKSSSMMKHSGAEPLGWRGGIFENWRSAIVKPAEGRRVKIEPKHNLRQVD